MKFIYIDGYRVNLDNVAMITDVEYNYSAHCATFVIYNIGGYNPTIYIPCDHPKRQALVDYDMMKRLTPELKEIVDEIIEEAKSWFAINVERHLA